MMRSVLAFFTLFATAFALKCYHCIGNDCDTAYTRITSTIDCPVGSFCQTAKFEYFDGEYNEVRSTHVARGCSVARGCMNSIGVDRCKADPQQFMLVGCPTRYCCDADLCNTIEGKDLI